MSLQFDIIASDGKARTGVLHTSRGDIHTPTITVNFTPALRNSQLKPQAVKDLGVELILVNAFHTQRDGVEDIHQEFGWSGPIICDSGGFQMISLAKFSHVHWHGVKFLWDEGWHNLTPETVVAWQKNMGVDIILPLDRVVPVMGTNLFSFWDSVLTTKRWFRRSVSIAPTQTYYIVQGGLNLSARTVSLRDANYWLDRCTPGVAIGGLAGGEAREDMYRIIDFCTDRLPADKPRHLLGVGTPKDLLEAIERGIDTFDCVAHTREGRHGRLWTANGHLELKYFQHCDDPSVIEPGCDCPACSSGITRSQLIIDISHYSSNDSPERHQQRMQAWAYCMLHNIRFTMRLMEQSRQAIRQGRFAQFKQDFLAKFG